MDALLPFTPELLCEPLIVLRDGLQFSGSFMLPVLTKLALQGGHAVVLVAVAQGQAHYQQALRKLGVNMAAHMQSGRLAIIDALTDADVLSEAELQAGAPKLLSLIVRAISVAQQPHAAAVSAALGTAADRATQSAAASSVNGLQAPAAGGSGVARGPDGEQQCPQPAVCVLIDDLTAVGSLVADTAVWRELLEKLLAIVMTGRLPESVSNGNGIHQTDGRGDHGLMDSPVSLTALLHSDVEDAAATDVLTSHAASVVVDIEPLTAGQSVDVSGRMRMQLQHCRTPVPWGGFEGDCQRQFFVKASDRGVRFLHQYTAA